MKIDQLFTLLYHAELQSYQKKISTIKGFPNVCLTYIDHTILFEHRKTRFLEILCIRVIKEKQKRSKYLLFLFLFFFLWVVWLCLTWHKLHALTTKMLDSNPWSGKKGLAPSYASWGQLKWQNLVAEAYYSVCHGKPQKKNPWKTLASCLPYPNLANQSCCLCWWWLRKMTGMPRSHTSRFLMFPTSSHLLEIDHHLPYGCSWWRINPTNFCSNLLQPPLYLCVLNDK